MNLNKPVLILLSLLAISCAKKPKQEITTRFDTNFETLKDKVKQLSEISRDWKDRPDTLTTDFDVYGNATQARRRNDCNCLGKYKYRYDKNGKKTEVILKNDARLFPYKYTYDTNDHIVELTVGTKEQRDYPPFSDKVDKGFYKYDPAGDMIEDDEYKSDGEYCYLIKYKYNDKHLLLERDFFEGAERYLETKAGYKYLSFDKKGNWIKRIITKHDNPSFYIGPKPKGSIKIDTEVRKIIYY